LWIGAVSRTESPPRSLPERKLLHYEIREPLGAGGMGEVYRAWDSKLGREVAIKLLPADLAADADRLARLEREAKLLASLDHPGIAAVHGLEEDAGRRFIVMELVEGETLAARIGRGGRIEVEEALETARRISEALAAAHDRGVVHRDLKPANVVVTEDSKVKVIDFGLAKRIEAHAAVDPGSATDSPTVTVAATATGVLLGTAPYMSPEQARGEPVDRRTDIWSFGAMLYEMLAGRRPFAGDSVQETLAAVLRDEPDWGALPAGVPPMARRLVARCLRKDARRRLRDIGDARIELEEALSAPEWASSEAIAPALTLHPAYRRGLRHGLGAGVAVALLGLVAWLFTLPEPSPVRTEYLDIRPPDGVDVAYHNGGTLAVSRDGERVGFAGRGADGVHRLYLRDLTRGPEAVLLEGTEGATGPFFSPDGDWIGFAADGVLKRVSVDGGKPLAVCDLPESDAMLLRGASWGEDGTILFAADQSLYRVSAEGAEDPMRVTVPDTERGEHRHRWPHILPGGRTAVFVVNKGLDESRHGIAVLSLDDYGYEEILTGGTFPQYAGTGHLVYSRLGTLAAVPFDPEDGRPTGDPEPLVHGVLYSVGAGWAAFGVSESGSLVYVPGDPRPWARVGELVWVDRQGHEEPLPGTRRRYAVRTRPGLSPDERRIAATIPVTPYDSDVHVYDVERGDWDLLSPAGGVDGALVWSPDGEWILFEGAEPTVPKIVRRRADGTGEPEQLTFGPEFDWAGSLSSDGSVLAFSRSGPGGWDIATMPVDGTAMPRMVRATPVLEWWPAFSPDDRYIAYESRGEGADGVYVAPYPGPGPHDKVSPDGARSPMWNPDGSELFYVQDRALWALPVETDPQFRRTGPARRLFEAEYLTGSTDRRFTVSADGERFLMVKYLPENATTLSLHHVSNWIEELKRTVPTRR